MKLTPEKLTAFCAALAETAQVSKACAAVGISRVTAYAWRKELPEFRDAWDHALKVGVSVLEDEAIRRAVEGVDDPLVHQGQFTPLFDPVLDPDGSHALDEKGSPRYQQRLDANGNPMVATVKKYSDTLLIFTLKAHAPEKYRDNTSIELTGKGGGPVQLDDGAAAARLAALIARAAARKQAQANGDDDDVSDLI
ncbi:hypothetical protein [Aquitalea palustris]|nr:hypothetical protein [Aquitalea palustris]